MEIELPDELTLDPKKITVVEVDRSKVQPTDGTKELYMVLEYLGKTGHGWYRYKVERFYDSNSDRRQKRLLPLWSR